jgi:hypothetical protein
MEMHSNSNINNNRLDTPKEMHIGDSLLSRKGADHHSRHSIRKTRRTTTASSNDHGRNKGRNPDDPWVVATRRLRTHKQGVVE